MNEFYDSIMRGLQEVSDNVSGKKRLPHKKVAIIPVKMYSADEVKSIRKSVGMTQCIFAKYMGVSSKTVEAWESGKNHPSDSSSRILSMMESNSNLTSEYPFVQIKG